MIIMEGKLVWRVSMIRYDKDNNKDKDKDKDKNKDNDKDKGRCEYLPVHLRK